MFKIIQSMANHGTASCINLGRAWATNSINTVIFRHHGVLTVGRFQFCAFYSSPTCLQVVRRDLSSGSVVIGTVPGLYNLADAHNSISMGCDRAGYLHLAYDHHATALRYRRSAASLSVDAWTSELTMTGHHEEKVTYPAFIVQADNRPLLMLYRDGVWNSGSARLKEYSETAQTWTDRDPAILSGAEQKPWTSNAYWNHPALGRDGSIHLSFVWRTHSLGAESRVNNINVGYARSSDQGRSWLSSRNRRFELPITPTNAETVFPVSPGSNLINQCGMALDVDQRPHLVFYSDDPDGIPQYQHVWFDGRQWMHHFISSRTERFVLAGSGTLQVPISRPDIVIDDENRAYVIYRGDLTDNRMVAQRLLPPNYEPDPTDVRILWDKPLGRAEPVIDRLRWHRDRVLTMLVQKNHQPSHDRSTKPSYESIYLLDWQLSMLFRDSR